MCLRVGRVGRWKIEVQYVSRVREGPTASQRTEKHREVKKKEEAMGRTAGHVEQEVDRLLGGRRGRLVREVHVARAAARRARRRAVRERLARRERAVRVRSGARLARAAGAELHAAADERADEWDGREGAEEEADGPLDRDAVEAPEGRARRLLLRGGVGARAGDQLLAVLDAVGAGALLVALLVPDAMPNACRIQVGEGTALVGGRTATLADGTHTAFCARGGLLL